MAHRPVPESQLRRYVLEASHETGLAPSLIRAVIQQESGGVADAGSPAGARGEMQLMPATARGLGVKNVDNPEQNIMGGAKYLASQLRRFGSIPLALAAYNAGPNAVAQHGGIPPYQETQNYVKSVMALEKQYTNIGNGQPTSSPTPMASPDTQGPALGPGANAAGGPTPAMQSAIDLFQHPSGLASQLQKIGGAAAAIGQRLGQPLALPASLTGPPPGAPGPAGATPAPAGGPSPDGKPAPPADALPSYGIKWTGQPLDGIRGSFLEKVAQAVASAGGTIVEVISGYRSPQHNKEVGGVPHSNHMTGDAMDGRAFIPNKGWVPLGVLLQQNQYGVRSGNVPGFYHGQPDPNHVDDSANQ